MQSVTSNAVAKAGSYSTEEHFTGRYLIIGNAKKKIYNKLFDITSTMNNNDIFSIPNLETVVDYGGQVIGNWGAVLCLPYYDLFNTNFRLAGVTSTGVQLYAYRDGSPSVIMSGSKIWVDYTKTTD